MGRAGMVAHLYVPGNMETTLAQMHFFKVMSSEGPVQSLQAVKVSRLPLSLASLQRPKAIWSDESESALKQR